METKKFAEEVIAVSEMGRQLDWANISDKDYIQFALLSQEVISSMHAMTVLESLKRSFFRHALILTAMVVVSLFCKFDGYKVALACCVLTAIRAAWTTFVCYVHVKSSVVLLDGLKEFINKRSLVEDKEE